MKDLNLFPVNWTHHRAFHNLSIQKETSSQHFATSFWYTTISIYPIEHVDCINHAATRFKYSRYWRPKQTTFYLYPTHLLTGTWWKDCISKCASPVPVKSLHIDLYQHYGRVKLFDWRNMKCFPGLYNLSHQHWNCWWTSLELIFVRLLKNFVIKNISQAIIKPFALIRLQTELPGALCSRLVRPPDKSGIPG